MWDNFWNVIGGVLKLSDSQSAALFVAGFGMYKAACGNGYLSAMGTVDGNVGFISTISFMISNNALASVACIALLVSALRVIRIPPAAGATVLYVLLALDFAVVPNFGISAFTGGLYGFVSACLSVAWLVLCLRLFRQPAIVLTNGFLASMVLQYVMSAYVLRDLLLSLALLAISAALFVFLMRRTDECEPRRPEHRKLDSDVSRVFFPALLCLMVCVFVVGVSNTAIYGSSIESMFGGVDMQLVNMISAIVAGLVVFCSARVPNPVRVYAVLLPVFFLVFSLVPILGEGLGPVAGAVMVGSYQVIAILFAAFSVEFVKAHALDYRAMGAVCIGGSNISLLLGLSAGLLLDMLSASGGFSLLILVAFAAIYPLGLVLFFVTRGAATANRAKREAFTDEPAANWDSAEALADVEALLQQRATGIAQDCGLTDREREILVFLARGRSAKVIADELTISENTAWSHIKRIYSRTGVHSKQAILDMFQSDFLKRD